MLGPVAAMALQARRRHLVRYALLRRRRQTTSRGLRHGEAVRALCRAGSRPTQERRGVAMHRLSLQTILELWSELEQALHGTNGFGGHTAEIYVYRDLPNTPGGHQENDILGGLDALYGLLMMFSGMRDAAITVDGRRIGKWMIDSRNDHRFHVRVRARAAGHPPRETER